MEDGFRVENVVEEIKTRIVSSGMSIAQRHLASPYYEKTMEEFKKQKEIVIVGSGVYGQRLYEMFEKEGIASLIRGFCDNSRERQELKIHGMDVLAVEETVWMYPHAHYIITPLRYENELLRQLCRLGISVEDITVYNYMYTGMAE